MKLHDLKPSDGATKKDRRLGRGQSSGYGGTSGRGHKGARSRSGYKRKRGFEGGQTPLYMRLPKRGFNSINRVEYTALNIGRLQEIVDKHDVTEINPEWLAENGIMGRKEKYKILADGSLNKSVNVSAHAASKSAKEAIEKAGGTLNIV